MDSTPPATATSHWLAMMALAAVAMVCSPEEQKRFTVWAETSLGRPASWVMSRAIFQPWVPSGLAQPTMTSSISPGSSSGTRASTPFNVSAAKLTGCTLARPPL